MRGVPAQILAMRNERSFLKVLPLTVIVSQLVSVIHFNAEATFEKIFENHWNPVMLVFIGKLLLSTLR